MKYARFLSALVVFSGLATGTTHAQFHRPNTRAVAKPAATGATGSAGIRHGSLGGPVNKGANIDGTTLLRKH